MARLSSAPWPETLDFESTLRLRAGVSEELVWTTACYEQTEKESWNSESGSMDPSANSPPMPRFVFVAYYPEGPHAGPDHHRPLRCPRRRHPAPSSPHGRRP